MIIEVSGDVTSPVARDMVLRKVRQEVQSFGRNVEVEDKLLILPPLPAARSA